MTDPIAALKAYDPDRDPDYLRLSHALDTPWTLQEQPRRSGLTKAIVYAGDPHRATVVLICEHARALTVDCLRYVVAMHNARLVNEQKADDPAEGGAPAPCPACPLRDEIAAGIAPLCDGCAPKTEGGAS